MKDKKGKKETVIMDRFHTAENKHYNQEKIDEIIVNTRNDNRPGHHHKDKKEEK